MKFVGDVEKDVAIDAGARVPAAVGDRGTIDADGDHVGRAAEVQVGCHVIFERDKTGRTRAKEMAVEPDLGVFIDTFEIDGDFLVAEVARKCERFAVPADAGGEVGGATGIFFVERAFDGPVVRKIESSPVGVGESWGLGICRIGVDEFPVGVEECRAGGR